MHAIESAKMGIVDSLRWMAENKADMIVRLQRFEEAVFMAQAEKEALAMMDAARAVKKISTFSSVGWLMVVLGRTSQSSHGGH